MSGKAKLRRKSGSATWTSLAPASTVHRALKTPNNYLRRAIVNLFGINRSTREGEGRNSGNGKGLEHSADEKSG